MMYNLAQHISE